MQTNDNEGGEADETFSLALAETKNAEPSIPAEVTILDDDVALSINNDTALEGDLLRFVVSVNATTDDTITVDWTTRSLTIGDVATPGPGPGGDYTPDNGTLTFDPGDEFKIIAIQTLDDDEPEPDEKLEIRLSNSQGASLGNRSAEGTILDDSPPPPHHHRQHRHRRRPAHLHPHSRPTPQPTHHSDSPRPGHGPGGSTASPEDYTLPDSATVIIEAGQRSATLTVPTVPDLLDEPDERLLLLIDPPAAPSTMAPPA